MAERQGVSPDPTETAYIQLENGFNTEENYIRRHALLREFALRQVQFEKDREYLIFPKIKYAEQRDQAQLAFAADLVLYKFRRDLQQRGQEALLDNPIILAIRNSGPFVGEALRKQLKLSKRQLLEVDKLDPDKDKDQLNDDSVFQAVSYGAQAQRNFRLPIKEILKLITKSTGLIVADDVVAEGKVMGATIGRLEEFGLKVHAGFAYFSKDWQGGVDAIQALGVPVYRALEIERLTGEGDKRKIEIAPFRGCPVTDSENMRNADFDPFHIEPFKESEYMVNANGQPVLELNGYRVGNRH